MDFEELVESRRSFKAFTDEKIPLEDVEKAVDLARRAPTAFNLQAYNFKLLTEESFQKAVECLSPGNEWVKDADKIVLIVSDERIDTHAGKALEDEVQKGGLSGEEAEEWRERLASYSGRDEVFKTGWLTRNSMIPATFLMLALWNQGIGSCMVRGFDRKKLAEILGLEAWERPELLLPIGIPERPEQEEKWRRPVEDILEVLD